MKNKIISIIGIGAILQWYSLFFSFKRLLDAYEEYNKSVATGGFPLKIYEYPPSPMGNDLSPPETWPWFSSQSSHMDCFKFFNCSC